MKKQSEPAVISGSESIYKSSLAHNFGIASPSEQIFSTSAGLYSSPRDSYLTYTDKSPSDRGDFCETFEKDSFNLYKKTMDLYNKDKKVLQRLHHLGFHKLKFINDNHIVLYSPSNCAGNSHAGWNLAKNISNSDKARLASKQLAYEKALANSDLWEFFATFTLDKKKQDRYDFKTALNHITKFLQYRHISYFMVPERHKNGAWHFHALLSAEMGEFLSDFEGKALTNPYIKKCLAEGRPVKNCKAYLDSFGYNTIEPCRDKEKCSFYMTKYVLKTFDDENFERVSKRRFFCSKGLKSPYVIMPGAVDLQQFEPEAFSRFTVKVYLRRADFFRDSTSLYSLVDSPADSRDSEPGDSSETRALSPPGITELSYSSV